MKAAAIVMAQTLYNALNKIDDRREYINALRDSHANSPRPNSALNGLYSWDEIDDSRLDVSADDPERCRVDVENIDDDGNGNGLVPGEAEHPGRSLPAAKEQIVIVEFERSLVLRRRNGVVTPLVTTTADARMTKAQYDAILRSRRGETHKAKPAKRDWNTELRVALAR